MNSLFGMAKTLFTKYHMSAECLVGLRPFNKVSPEHILFGRANTILTNEQSVWYGKKTFNKVSQERTLFSRANTQIIT